jgi:carboxypeptidase PM20D1
VRYLFGALAVGLAILVGLLLANTYRQQPQPRPRQVAGAAATDSSAVDARLVAEHLASALRLQTVSHQDPRDDDPNVFRTFRTFLETTYPRVHATFTRELIHGDALLYRWPGSDPRALPVLFLAHQDVVPIEAGSESKWTHPAFDGVVADGFVWGRGALDDKGPLVCLFEAFESLLRNNWRPTRTVYFASGQDEEVGGKLGARQIAAELKKRGLKFGWVLDEGSSVVHGVMEDIARPVAAISVSEKGYVSVELISHAEGGHSSTPPADTAIGMLATAIDRLQKRPFDARLLPTVQQSLATLAPEMSLARRVMFTNLWFTAPLAAQLLTAERETAPTVRTTIAPTMLQAGVKENVLPTTAHAVVNFRILPGDSIATVLHHVQRAVANRHIEIKKLERTLSEPAPLSSTTGSGYALLEATIRRYFPQAIVVPGLTLGATDSRHFQAVASDIYRFVPRMLEKSDLKRVHGSDERASIESLSRMVQAYRSLLEQAAGKVQ